MYGKVDKDYCLLKCSSMYSDTLHTSILEESATDLPEYMVSHLRRP